MLVLRLKKVYLKNNNNTEFLYYFVVGDKKHPPYKNKHIDKVGVYDPRLDNMNNKKVTLNLDKLDFWIKKGLKMDFKLFNLIFPILFYNYNKDK